jgi:hypothetical protein
LRRFPGGGKLDYQPLKFQEAEYVRAEVQTPSVGPEAANVIKEAVAEQ